MKHLSIILAGALFIVSCAKTVQNGNLLPEKDNQRIQVRLGVVGGDTQNPQEVKSSGVSSGETGIRSVNFFIFNPDGTLDAAASSQSSSATLSVMAGSGKTVWAVVNPDSNLSSSVSNTDELKDITTSILTSPDGGKYFAMAGKTAPITIDPTTESISVAVKRIPAKIILSKVTNNLNPALGDLRITDIFLSNVVSDAYFFKQENGPTWINKFGKDLSDREWIAQTALELDIPNGSSLSQSHYFYCCPNYTESDSVASLWCPRSTRLVVAAMVRDKKYYWTVSLSSRIPGGRILPNKCYVISDLIVRHLGSDDPETILTPTDIDFNITVSDWETEEIDPISI